MQEACAAYGRLIAAALTGLSKDDLDVQRAMRVIDVIAGCSGGFGGNYLRKSRDEISSAGYVVDTLEAALWAFAHADDFATGALLAVNLGNDADTVGAVYGQLAGAYFGFTGIPPNGQVSSMTST